MAKTINLEKYIEFPTLSKSTDTFAGINFHCHGQMLDKIQQAQQRGDRLHFSKQLRTNLRCCALLGTSSYLQSGLSICTYYHQDGYAEPVMKSLISTDGEVINQISGDCLRHQLYPQLTTAHYWFLQQITRKLVWQRTLIVDLLAWSIATLLIVALILAYPQGIITNIVALVMAVIIIWILQKILKFLLSFKAKAIDQWAIAKFLSFSISPQPWQQKMAKLFLQYIVV
ncbi:MAG: hypothetical protein HC916_12550 [Coleofasciculaceae cyanobacterium SM2_1_6]|nr:hypothetical protein [Coleofasciculaceae cyanobacterium SM2_1_6]